MKFSRVLDAGEELILVDRAALHRVVKERDELKKKVELANKGTHS